MDARIVALAKAVKEKALTDAREGLKVGTHPIDMTLHIIGSIKVGEDGRTDVRGKAIDYKGAFATICGILIQQLKLRNNGTLDPAIKGMIGMAMRQGKIATVIGDATKEIVETIERDSTQVTGTKLKKGSVTTRLEYEFVEIVPVEQVEQKMAS